MTARVTLAAALIAGCAVAVPGADVVILKDGFVIQGHVSKETTTVIDKASGRAIPIVKGNGFDMIDEGAKVTVFSTHAKQLGGISPDTKLRPDMKAYTMPFPGRKGNAPIPAGGATLKIGEYNAKWVRTLSVAVPGAAPETVDQQITYLDPYYLYIVSATHQWRLTYRTSEWDPKLVRKLLMTHPDIAEPDGKCDPIKRFALAKFMLDAGWLQIAKDEVDRFKRDHLGAMSIVEQGEHDKLVKEIDIATAELVVREAELALAAGRYKYAAELLAVFPEKTAGPKEVARAAKVTADLKTSQERHDAGRRLLRAVIDDVTGMRAVHARVAAAGGLALVSWQPPPATPGLALDLAAAGERVYAELHPDSALRIETFVTLALQVERDRAAGREPTKKPEELLATVVSGWAKGKNGATPNPDGAMNLWRAREAVLAYQRAETMNDRTAVLGRYKKNITLAIDELAQMISLLPPAAPEDLLDRTGTQVPLGKNKDTGISRRKTLPVPGHAGGIDYLVKLPPEYHHGRAYPVLILLTHPGIATEDVLAPLVAEADKNGYIVVVPEWAGLFGKGWQWQGEDHVYVTAVLRDAIRHFTVDNDRVFMIGIGEGANMAMDIGMSHPDLFAGVIPMGPIPKWQGLFIEYWRNAQKLPFFVVTGEQSGDGLANLRKIYEKWMPRGYPALMSVYKGRGVEWFAAETPVLFDWMSRKARVNGTATLALGTGAGAREPWQMNRDTDTRFYWLQADQIAPGKNGGAIVPASMMGDISGNNFISVSTKQVRKLTIWLSGDMIDWTKPVRVALNSSIPAGYKPKVMEPNLEVLLEDYYARGDRRMLFLNKLEFGNIP